MKHTLLQCGLAIAFSLAVAAPASAQDRGYDEGYRPPATRDGYPVPQGPDRDGPPPYSSYKDDGGPPPPRREGRCLDKFGIQRALHEQGWHNFDNVEIQGPVAYMTARTERGAPFDLKIDSCSGRVIEEHPLVAYRDGPPPDYFYPRPTVGFYFGGGGYHREGGRHWR